MGKKNALKSLMDSIMNVVAPALLLAVLQVLLIWVLFVQPTVNSLVNQIPGIAGNLAILPLTIGLFVTLSLVNIVMVVLLRLDLVQKFLKLKVAVSG